MKFGMILLTVGLAGVQAFSYGIRDLGTQQQELAKAQANIAGWERALAEKKKNLEAIQARIASATTNYNAESVKTTTVCTPGWFGDSCTSTEEKVPVPKAIVDAKAAADKEAEGVPQLQAQIAEGEKALAEWKKIQKERTGDISKLTAEQKTQQETFDYWLGNVRNDMNTIRVDLLQVNSMLDKINDTYDKAVLGVYLRDKMAKLLTSDAMCKAQEMCKSGNKDLSQIQQFLKKDVFPSQKFDGRTSAPAKAVQPGGTR